jgi:hypothetical protein
MKISIFWDRILCDLVAKHELLEAPAAFVCMCTYFRDVDIYHTTRRHIPAHITVQRTSYVTSDAIPAVHGTYITISMKQTDWFRNLYSLQICLMIICDQFLWLAPQS